MAVQDILKYIETHGGRYRLDVLVDQLRQAGYPENEIQKALRMKDVPVPPLPGSSKAVWKRVLVWIGAFVGVIVVAVVALIILLSFNTRPRHTRDARRVSDVKQIQLALELYYDSNHYKYPDRLDDLARQDACSGTPCMPSVPKDPVNLTPYYYEKKSDCSYYLSAVFDDPSNPILKSDINPSNSLYEVGEGISTSGALPCPTPTPLLPAQNPNKNFSDGPIANPFSGKPYEEKKINGYVTAVSGNRYLRITSPNGGERLCIGKDFVVKWESSGLRTVNFDIRQGNYGAQYPLGVYPADFNETGTKGSGKFVWRIGTTSGGVALRDGYAYEIVVNSTDGGSLIADTSDNVFSVLTCEG